MSSSGEIRQSAHVGLAILIALLAVVLLQWFTPDQTVVAIADRFLCEGVAGVNTQASAKLGLVHTVECRTFGGAEDMTALAMLALFIPCALVVGTAGLLGRRMLRGRDRRSYRLRTVHS